MTRGQKTATFAMHFFALSEPKIDVFEQKTAVLGAFFDVFEDI